MYLKISRKSFLEFQIWIKRLCEVNRKSECLDKVVPENVDEERQNQVNVIWLKREDTRLNLEKNSLLPLDFSKEE